MFDQYKKMMGLAPALGLIFGAGAGLLISIPAKWDAAILMISCSVFGLIIGAAVHSLTQKNKP